MNLVSCEKHTADLALKQDKLLDCNGAPLAAGTRMATCDDIPTVSTYLGVGQNTSLSGTGTEADPFRVNVATAGDTLPGIVQLATAANHPSTSDTEAATPAYVAAAIAAIPADPVSTLAVEGVNYVHTDELGVKTVIQPGQFLSSDAGNAIGMDAQGRLKIAIPVQLPDDQILTGDNSGTVGLTLTPVTIGDSSLGTAQTNYTIKADLKVAATTPSGAVNHLKWSPSGYYVEILDVFCE